MEAGIFARELYEELAERAQQEAGNEIDWFDQRRLEDTTITRRQEAPESPLQSPGVKAKQVGAETATLGRTFIRDANDAIAFSKLSRYETAIERSLFKALHEHQRLQAARGAGGNVSPPAAVDVDVSGIPSEGL